MLTFNAHANTSLANFTSPFGGDSFLEQYFDAVVQGPSIVKWRHYFDIYERHLAHFRGTDVHIAEIGLFSGGSLQMWRRYFGDRATIYGIDNDARARRYQRKRWFGYPNRVFIGDQGDERFWHRFKKMGPRLDILIDDGSHISGHQIVTLEQVLPHLSPGGVFLCEDVAVRVEKEDESRNNFLQFVLDKYVLKDFYRMQLPGSLKRPPMSMVADSSEGQGRIAEVSFYPFVVVLQKLPQQQIGRSMVSQIHGSDQVIGGGLGHSGRNVSLELEQRHALWVAWSCHRRGASLILPCNKLSAG